MTYVKIDSVWIKLVDIVSYTYNIQDLFSIECMNTCCHKILKNAPKASTEEKSSSCY